MGFLQRIFGAGDPAADLARAERLLAEGKAERALALAERALGRGDDTRARALATQAQRALHDHRLAQARRAEDADYFEDALEWLRLAHDEGAGDGERAGLAQRIADLERRLEDQRREDHARPLPEAEDGAGEAAWEIDPDELYDSLVSSLDDTVAERYQRRSAAFRDGCVALAQGDAEAALAAFATADDDDPVLPLERGRARLLAGRAAAAREDFETAWPAFGDAALDRAGALSLPLLWADAALADGRPQAVLDRLAEPAVDDPGGLELAERWAQALIDTARLDDARAFLERLLAAVPGAAFASFALAQILIRQDQPRAAIACLEAAVAPSCHSGCARPPLDRPSARALIALHLGEAGDQARARTLLEHLSAAQRGRLEAADCRLWAQYHELAGEPEAAAEARAAAAALAG